MLRKAAKALYQVKDIDWNLILAQLKLFAQNDKFTEEEMHNYRMAVTEREVWWLSNWDFDSQISC